jgi:hypothetical protein
MPTFSDILDASPDVLTEDVPVRNPAKATPTAAASPDFQSILEASPDLFPGRREVPNRDQRSVGGEFIHAAIEPAKSLIKAPSLLTMTDDEWYDWLKGEHAQERHRTSGRFTAALHGCGRVAGDGEFRRIIGWRPANKRHGCRPSFTLE